MIKVGPRIAAAIRVVCPYEAVAFVRADLGTTNDEESPEVLSAHRRMQRETAALVTFGSERR
jgi:hypothetical protein